MTESSSMEVRGLLFGREVAATLSRVPGRPGERRQWRSALTGDLFVVFLPSNKAPEYVVMLAVPETEEVSSLRGEGSTFQAALDDLAQRIAGVRKWAEAFQEETT